MRIRNLVFLVLTACRQPVACDPIQAHFEDVSVTIESSEDATTVMVGVYVCPWDTDCQAQDLRNDECFEVTKLTLNPDSCTQISPAERLAGDPSIDSEFEDGIVFLFVDVGEESDGTLACCPSSTGQGGVAVTKSGAQCLEGEVVCVI